MKISTIFTLQPRFYGFLYLGVIPLFALILRVVPGVFEDPVSFLDTLYFSVVTITTLGYGDITPHSDVGKLLCASESLIGIVLIGLFLNALSRKHSESIREEEASRERERYRQAEIAKLHGHFRLIAPIIEKHKANVVQVSSPIVAGKERKYDPDFTLKDMKDLYKGGMLMSQSHSEPAIKHYFSSLELLTDRLCHLITGVDLRLFPSLEQKCQLFAQARHSLDYSSALLAVPGTRLGEQSMQMFVEDILSKHDGAAEFQHSNVINWFVALHNQIKAQMALIDGIANDIKEIGVAS